MENFDVDIRESFKITLTLVNLNLPEIIQLCQIMSYIEKFKELIKIAETWEWLALTADPRLERWIFLFLLKVLLNVYVFVLPTNEIV